MGASVLLRHRLPDGSGHYDWMIQREEGPGAPLITFRVLERIDRGGVHEFEAQRIAEHRPAYLEFEGPVSGGRGTVERLARGTLTVIAEGDGRLELAGSLGGLAGKFVGEGRGEHWRFVVEAG